MARAGAEHTSLGAIPAQHRLPQNPSDTKCYTTCPVVLLLSVSMCMCKGTEVCNLKLFR